MRRFSIRALMAVVVVCAIGLAAIRHCSPFWAGAMFSVVFFAMTCAVLGIVFGRGKRRVFWTGFATLGWTYLLLAFVPPLNQGVGQYLLAPNLIVSILDLLVPPSPPAPMPMPMQGIPPGPGPGMQSMPVAMPGSAVVGGGFGGPVAVTVTSPGVDIDVCLRIGMVLEALLWATLGGYAALHFASGREAARPPAGATPADDVHGPGSRQGE